MTAPTAVDPELLEHRLRDLDAAERRLANLVAVDDLARDRLVLRRDDGDLVDARLDPLADRLQQLAAAGDLVQEGEHGAAVPVGGRDRSLHRRARGHGLRLPAGAGAPRARAARPRPRHGPRIACRAPGTPYSYGPPTTRGISSKLKIGGGEETSHSIVFARHGLAPAFGPHRQLTTML